MRTELSLAPTPEGRSVFKQFSEVMLTTRIDGLSKIYTAASDAYAHGIAESEFPSF